MRVFFYTEYSRKGPNSRYRIHQFQNLFRGIGIKTRCFPFFPDRYLEDLYEGSHPSVPISDIYWRRTRDIKWVGDCDLAVVEREFFPFLPAAFEKGAFKRAHRILLDFDDAVFFQYQHHPRRTVRWLLGKKMDRLISWSDGIIGGSRFLCEYARRHVARTWTVPTSVDTEKYTPHDHNHDGLITLGWVGTPLTVGQLALVRRPVERLAKEVPLRLMVVGAPAPVWKGVEAYSVEWSEEKEAEWIRWMDIGLVPEEETVWEFGKSSFEVLQCMAGQVVPVVSDTLANREIISHGQDGFLCRTEDEWFECLLDLATSSSCRASVGQAARRKVVSHHSQATACKQLVQIFREVLGEREPWSPDTKDLLPGGSLAPLTEGRE